MLFAGFLTSTDRASLVWMLLAAAAGAVLGDSVGYEIGCRSGPAHPESRVAPREPDVPPAAGSVGFHLDEHASVGSRASDADAFMPTFAHSTRGRRHAIT